MLQSATAQGYSRASRFWTVQFPLAGPVLLANLRVVSVSTVSLLSVAALDRHRAASATCSPTGTSAQFTDEIVIGIVFTLLLALVFDLILVIARPHAACRGRGATAASGRAASLIHVPSGCGGAA